MKKTVFALISVVLCSSFAFAANVVQCNRETSGYALEIHGSSEPSIVAGEYEFLKIDVQFFNRGVVSYFKTRGFEIVANPDFAYLPAIETVVAVKESAKNPYHYVFMDQERGNRWTFDRQGEGLKVVATNVYTQQSANWFYEHCYFQ